MAKFLTIATVIMLSILAISGYIGNIIILAGMAWDTGLSIEALLRVIGIVVAPLGAVMGYV